jgi:hypothetical protein
MSPALPFGEQYNQSLGDFIMEQIGQPVVLDESWAAAGHAVTQAQYLLEELRGLEGRLSARSAAAVRAARHYLSRRLPEDSDADERLALTRSLYEAASNGDGAEHWNPERHSDVAVRVSGSLAHVYLNVSEQRLSVSDIALLYPTLLAHLIEHPGIGLVVGREGEETVMMGRAGTLARHKTADRLHGSNPLAGLSSPGELAARIDDVASYPHSGDLMLLGAWDNGTVVTFEDQIGTHGGVGGPQERPFILYPAGIELPSATIKSPCDLYPLFARYLNLEPDEEGRDAALDSAEIGQRPAEQMASAFEEERRQVGRAVVAALFASSWCCRTPVQMAYSSPYFRLR